MFEPSVCCGRLRAGSAGEYEHPAYGMGVARANPVGLDGVDRLDGVRVHETILRLGERIAARFPERGLGRIPAELAQIAQEVIPGGTGHPRRTKILAWAGRILALVVILGTVVLFAMAVRDAIHHGPDQSFEWVPIIESAINDLVFAGLAVFFLQALPERLERTHLLRILHRLCSLAHIVDMHQLTKDPERLRPGFQPSPKSADPALNRDDLEHYLDYCSELLSLIGKVAALCAETSEDSVVLDTISTIETMTTEMAGKIWQKISLLPD